MASTKIYLDKRRAKDDGTYPLKIMLTHLRQSTLIPLGIDLSPSHWDDTTKQVIGQNNHTFLNTFIERRKTEIDVLLLKLTEDGSIYRYNARKLKEVIEHTLEPLKDDSKRAMGLFSRHYVEVMESKSAPRTRECYLTTLRHLQRYMGDKLDTLTFEDINKAWLTAFDKYLQQTSPSQNARNIHLRNIRTVFNDAIDNGITTNYPFRHFNMKPVATKHRSLTVEKLRQLFSYPCEDWQQPYIDVFKLIFFLCGINIIDLFNLTEIVDGRIEYYRAKTHKLYSIKVEPEALAIIEKYKGKRHLLNIADRYHNYRDYTHRLNKTVQQVGEYERVGRGGKKVFSSLFPDITTYWMRHTWATIASELDIPDDTISRALGHTQTSGARVTQVYINFNNKKIDDANRRVIDYVLYDKK